MSSASRTTKPLSARLKVGQRNDMHRYLKRTNES
jgi:hypothetical protein